MHRVFQLKGLLKNNAKWNLVMNCAVPENIHTPPPHGRVFFILTPQPSEISGFSKLSSLNPSEVQNPFRLRKIEDSHYYEKFFYYWSNVAYSSQAI